MDGFYNKNAYVAICLNTKDSFLDYIDLTLKRNKMNIRTLLAILIVSQSFNSCDN